MSYKVLKEDLKKKNEIFPQKILITIADLIQSNFQTLRQNIPQKNLTDLFMGAIFIALPSLEQIYMELIENEKKGQKKDEMIAELIKNNEILRSRIQQLDQQNIAKGKLIPKIKFIKVTSNSSVNSKTQPKQNSQNNYEIDLLNLQKQVEKQENEIKKYENSEQEMEENKIKLYVEIRKQKDLYEKKQISIDQFHEEIFILVSPKLPIAYILGQVGVGKTFIMNKLFDNLIIKEFQLELLIDLKTYFVDTQAFDFKSDIDLREEQIQKHQKVFTTYPNKVASLLIVVNFERTDMMKNKFMAVYRYFKKFSKKVSLIVTDFHLSQNPDVDEQHLRENFANYKLKDIIFIGKQIDRQGLIEKLRQISPQQNKEQEYSFDLNDTMFEVENIEETNQAILNLQQQLQG